MQYHGDPPWGNIQATLTDIQRIPTCAPWCNGRIERLFGTLKPLLRQLLIPSLAALQLALEEFTLFYNHARSHQNLVGQTPAQKWNGWSRTDLLQTLTIHFFEMELIISIKPLS